MYRALCLLCVLVCSITSLEARVSPGENSTLNYRLIGFSFPAVVGVHSYSVEIAMGNYTTGPEFKKNIVNALQTTENRVVGEVPSFGREYTWRVSYSGKGATVNGKLHHFSSAISDEVDSIVTRLAILKTAEKYKGAYVFLDGSDALYDMEGHPVWYLPLTGKLNPKKNKIMDLKLTPQGTITFLAGQKIFEVDYNGHVLWEGPDNEKTGSNSTTAHYHHEFTRLNNGHYMVLGNEFVKMALPVYQDNKTGNITDTAKKTAAFGTVIEYDKFGKIVWRWRSADYFRKIDPVYLKSDLYDPLAPQGTEDVHENVFYFDEKKKVVYVSFKNISTIIKVKYPEGNVLNVYGKLAALTGAKTIRQPFCGQHSCKISEDGNLYLYNNNSCTKGKLPQILFFDQPTISLDTLKKVWEYTCNFDDVMAHKLKEQQRSGEKDTIPSAKQLGNYGVFSKGSNVVELPDHSVFANICGPYGKVFIITPEKKEVWSALLETWNPYKKKWDDIFYYKANLVTDTKDIARLIWNSERNQH